jgi:hypothetical protein
MKCEICNHEMDEGFLGSNSYIIFTKEKKSVFPKDPVYITKTTSLLTHIYVPANVCFFCNRGTFTFKRE